MLKDRLKSILGGHSRPEGSGSGLRIAESPPKGPPITRPSNGLEQFFFSLRDRVGLTLLDFAGASQANISFITSLGHRLASEDYVRSLELNFGDGDFYANQTDVERLGKFKDENLDFPEGHFDGALVWDSLQFLGPELLQETVDQLYTILRPGASMLAFFSAEEKNEVVTTYHYRIADAKTLSLLARGQRKRAQFFNNRALERLFGKYQNVKFFLTRDSLREVIIKR